MLLNLSSDNILTYELNDHYSIAYTQVSHLDMQRQLETSD
jgi:hypothetical protein